MEIIMNVLEKIVVLREERHWTEYQLAEHSGLTQSTISSWYRKDMLPSIPSLNKICDAFGITLSQFFSEGEERTLSLTKHQLDLLRAAEKLEPAQYEALINFLNSF